MYIVKNTNGYQLSGIYFMIKIKCPRCKHIQLTEKFISNTTSMKVNKICNNCINQQLNRFHNFVNLGMCGSCKKTKSASDKKTCEICLNKIKKKQEEKRNIARHNKLCISCYKLPIEETYSKCSLCRRRDILSIKTKMFRNAKSRAKKKNLQFLINEEDIIIPTHCPILGIKLEENKKYSKNNSYSLDRIDNSKGYIKGNIHVISYRANQIKNDATLLELKILVQYLEKITNVKL